MQNWVVIDEKYLDFLRKTEKRIPFSDYGTDKHKPFFGVLFEIGDLAYVTQISHAQPRHIKLRNAPDFIKIFIPDRNPVNPDRLVAVVNLNYMFPIHKSLVEKLEYKDIEKHRTFKSPQEKSQYIDLLTKELEQINKLNIDTKARKLYEKKKRFPSDAAAQRCIDFCALEPLAEAYVKAQTAEDNTEA